MTSSDQDPPKPDGRKDDRKARLAERLRANLLRRKAQARSRREGEADSRPDGLPRRNGDDRKDGD